MNTYLSQRKVDSFARVLDACRGVGIDFENAIDGGAGAGHTSTTMLKYLKAQNQVFAFEPFPGNHKFFANRDKRIVLIPKALAEANKKMNFHVPSVVSEDSVWGQKGMAGYSSVGYLTEEKLDTSKTLEVDCVSADCVVNSKVGFVKLDLQGGELNALVGMRRLLGDVVLMWVEYTGQKGLLDFLQDQNFVMFDTEYFFMGAPSDAMKALFDVSKEGVPLSTGALASFAFKKSDWNNFEVEFLEYRRILGLVQTDLVCVKKTFVDEFVSAFSTL